MEQALKQISMGKMTKLGKLATVGWITFGLLLLDAFLNNARVITWLMSPY